jgi:hypothetical protein
MTDNHEDFASTADVALHLALKIALCDEEKQKKKNREYWLTLYRQCWKAANGRSLEGLLKED